MGFGGGPRGYYIRAETFASSRRDSRADDDDNDEVGAADTQTAQRERRQTRTVAPEKNNKKNHQRPCHERPDCLLVLLWFLSRLLPPITKGTSVCLPLPNFNFTRSPRPRNRRQFKPTHPLTPPLLHMHPPLATPSRDGAALHGLPAPVALHRVLRVVRHVHLVQVPPQLIREAQRPLRPVMTVLVGRGGWLAVVAVSRVGILWLACV